MKALTAALLLTSLSSLVYSQSFYLKLGGGYSFPATSNVIGTDRLVLSILHTDPETGFWIPSSAQAETIVTGSYNSGVVSSFTFGFMFSSIIGVEVNTGYVHGKRYVTIDERREILDEVVLATGKSTMEMSSTNFYVSPSLVLTTNVGRLIKPYALAGVVLASTNIDHSFRRQSDLSTDQFRNERREESYRGGMTVGLRGGAGIDIKIGERWSLFSELALTGMSYYPKKWEQTKNERDGENLLITIPESNRKKTFVRSKHFDSHSTQVGTDQPAQSLRVSFEMSGLAVQAGLKVHL